ncbi:AAEL004184-PA [Aedes aegypti]|uniref:AAEL004184-PA n=1 Tax=Aedes aegypti TaxID=7159 RepID=Q0IFS8_AEDAE|nr:AAEL004184-PA [Aedes aegypti]
MFLGMGRIVAAATTSRQKQLTGRWHFPLPSSWMTDRGGVVGKLSPRPGHRTMGGGVGSFQGQQGSRAAEYLCGKRSRNGICKMRG